MAFSDSSKGGPSALPNGTPKDKYVDFFFSQFAYYTSVVRENDENKINNATVALMTICPDKEIRERLFKAYTEKRNNSGGDIATASADLAGDFMSYISETLEFTEKSYGSVF